MIAIHTKFISPTDKRGSRIKAYTADGRSVTIPLDHALDDMRRHFQAAEAFIAKHMKHAPDTANMVYGDSADGKGYVFCFGESRVFPRSV
jgi:hypothetical protein